MRGRGLLGRTVGRVVTRVIPNMNKSRSRFMVGERTEAGDTRGRFSDVRVTSSGLGVSVSVAINSRASADEWTFRTRADTFVAVRFAADGTVFAARTLGPDQDTSVSGLSAEGPAFEAPGVRAALRRNEKFRDLDDAARIGLAVPLFGARLVRALATNALISAGAPMVDSLLRFVPDAHRYRGRPDRS